MTKEPGSSHRSRSHIAAWLAAVILAALAGIWAGSTFFRPSVEQPPTAATRTYEVQQGSVEKTIDLIASASWSTQVVAKAATAGTVTSIDLEQDRAAKAGDRLLTVDLRPSTLAQGDIPAFRELKRGTSGPDVRQLQQFLATQRHEVEVTGTFDEATERAVNAWHQQQALPTDGVVKAGDLVFVPVLPVRLSLAEGIAVGAVVSPGTDLVTAVAGEPTVELTLTLDQVGSVPTSGNVQVSKDAWTWPGKMGRSIQLPSGELVLPIVAPDDGGVCGADCIEAIPLGLPVLLQTSLQVVPAQTGPLVPVAAIATGPDNTTTVTRADGTVQPVKVLASVDGLAVVEGINVGDVVQLPGLGGQP